MTRVRLQIVVITLVTCGYLSVAQVVLNRFRLFF